MEDYQLEDYRSELSYRVRHICGMNTQITARQDYHNSLNLICVYFIEGTGQITINGTTHEINAGDIVLLNPSEYFLFQVANGIFHERIVLNVNMKMAKVFSYNCFAAFSTLYKRKERTKNILPANEVSKHGVGRLFWDLLDAARDKSEFGELLTICKTVEILCKISKLIADIPESQHRLKKDTLIDQVLDYINDHCEETTSIQQIADHFHVHRSYLLHKFKKILGISVWNYVIIRRIHKFNSAINSGASLEEIAFRVGFKNYSNFFKLYKKHMGITPMEFKQQSLDAN